MRDISVLSRRDLLRMAGAVGGLAVMGIREAIEKSICVRSCPRSALRRANGVV